MMCELATLILWCLSAVVGIRQEVVIQRELRRIQIYSQKLICMFKIKEEEV